MKKWKKVVLILFSILAGILAILTLWANWRFIGLTKDTFGINYGTDKTILSFDTERDFHGDGFSIEVYQLDQESVEYYKNPPPDFFTNYPKRHYHLGEYVIFRWLKTPQRRDDIFKTSFANEDAYYESPPIDSMNGSLGRVPLICSPEDYHEIEKYLLYSKKILNTPGSYYSMFFCDHPYKLYAIDLFIISPKDGILIKINKQ